jgi:uncharacterized small protein (DUF1192 family)
MRVWLMALILGASLFIHGAAAQAQSDAAAATTANSTSSTTLPSEEDDDAGAVTATSAADAGQSMTGEQFVVRLRDLEQRINELKEEIFRSKARLSLLAESILQNVIGGARAIIQHENQMGALYRLVRAVYSLDGAPILTRTDDNGSLADQREFPVYNGQIGAGDHSLTVNLEYQGNGYGIFSYVKGYQFRVRSTHSFSVPEGKAIQIRVIGYEQGGPLTPHNERTAIRFQPRIVSLRDVQDTDAPTEAQSGANNAQPAQGAQGAQNSTSGGR